MQPVTFTRMNATPVSPITMSAADESTETLALRLKEILDRGGGVSDFDAVVIIKELGKRGIRTFPAINAAVGRKVFLSETGDIELPVTMSVLGWPGAVVCTACNEWMEMPTPAASRIRPTEKPARISDLPCP